MVGLNECFDFGIEGMAEYFIQFLDRNNIEHRVDEDGDVEILATEREMELINDLLAVTKVVML